MAYNQRKITGVMPFAYSKDDAQWIDERLSILGITERSVVANAYGKAYREAEDLEPVDYRKEGRGRFSANQRLLRFINKKLYIDNE